MDQSEFDKFADEYLSIHEKNIRMSGESPEFFAEYKIRDISEAVRSTGPVSNILDFGSGVGNSVPHVEKYFPQSHLTCLDVSGRSLEISKERFGDRVKHSLFDGENIPFSCGTFDIAYAACVFHHIAVAKHKQLLLELRRVLKPGGLLFVFEHNPLNPLTIQAVNTCPFDENANLIRGAQMRSVFEEAGYDDVDVRFRIFFPSFLSSLRTFERYMTWLPFGAQYYVRGRKPG